MVVMMVGVVLIMRMVIDIDDDHPCLRVGCDDGDPYLREGYDEY